jgi:hypothetical protein
LEQKIDREKFGFGLTDGSVAYADEWTYSDQDGEYTLTTWPSVAGLICTKVTLFEDHVVWVAELVPENEVVTYD